MLAHLPRGQLCQSVMMRLNSTSTSPPQVFLPPSFNGQNLLVVLFLDDSCLIIANHISSVTYS